MRRHDAEKGGMDALGAAELAFAVGFGSAACAVEQSFRASRVGHGGAFPEQRSLGFEEDRCGVTFFGKDSGGCGVYGASKQEAEPVFEAWRGDFSFRDFGRFWRAFSEEILIKVVSMWVRSHVSAGEIVEI